MMSTAFLVLLLLCLPTLLANAFSAPSAKKRIFGIPGAGWKSPDWNWGSPFGTGHDCAVACRRRFDTQAKRQELVTSLIRADTDTDTAIVSFEEVKLVLALAWQRACKVDPSMEPYGQILDEMAKAERYEDAGDDEACSRLLVQDMQKRYMWLEPEVEDKIAMNLLWYDTEDYDVARRRCSGLVLKSMGFVEDGL